jgi:arylsulfatase A-like enzyme
MAVTGDHGAVTIPEHLAEDGLSARRGNREDFASLRSIFRAFQENEGNVEGLGDSLVLELESLPFVADALTVFELTTPPPADSFVVFIRNSYHPDRWIGGYGSQGSEVVFRFEERFYASSDSHGTGHGSPYYYDRHVPLVFYGPGVSAGVSHEPVRTVDIAPTLAHLAGIETPPDLDGQPLLR